MYVYILGGFLGSGKTSLLMELTSMYIGKGKNVAIIVNEAGDIGVDGATLKRKGYNALELPNGCICCTLSGSLQDGLRSIIKDVDPDIIIIEPTGLALPHKVKEIVRIAMIDQKETYIIGVIDAQRFELLMEKKKDFFKRQMHNSDFILINKSDLASPEKIAEISNWISSEYPDKKFLPISIKTDENRDKVYELMV